MDEDPVEKLILNAGDLSLSPAERERLNTVLARAMERGSRERERFKTLPPSDKINVLAQAFYAQGPGGEMGSFDFDELPEIDQERQSFVDRSTYRQMAWVALVMLGAGDAELMEPRRWEWKRYREVYAEPGGKLPHERIKELTLEGWEVVGPGLRRRVYGELEQRAIDKALEVQPRGKIRGAAQSGDRVRVDVIIHTVLGPDYETYLFADGTLRRVELDDLSWEEEDQRQN